jgi:hypothetical protein
MRKLSEDELKHIERATPRKLGIRGTVVPGLGVKLHLDLREEPPDPVDTARLDMAAVGELETIYRANMYDSGTRWIAAQEGPTFAAMGGPVLCFYHDEDVALSTGALCLGSSGDNGASTVEEAAALFIGLYNNAPALLRLAAVAGQALNALEQAERDHPSELTRAAIDALLGAGVTATEVSPRPP